jgi:hypothetical protein
MKNYQKFLVPIGAVLLTAWAWQTSGWMGVFMVFTGGVMWVLMYFTRLVQIMKRASNRPIGFVDSAVMLNAKLKKGVNLMHVIAMTKSLGERVTEADAQPEIFKWTDTGESFVVCTFKDGKLTSWEMSRPADPDAA